jgi:hypothetical protein
MKTMQSRLDATEQENRELKEQIEKMEQQAAQESSKTSSNVEAALDNAYLDFVVSSWSNDLYVHLAAFVSMMQSVAATPQNSNDKEWVKEYNEVAIAIKVTCEEMLDYDINLVPSKYTFVHEMLVLGATDVTMAMDYFVIGMANSNVDNFDKAEDLINSGGQYLTEALGILKEFPTSEESSITSSSSASSRSTVQFTNKFGTPTTICAVSGCNKYIASSGDTNCCATHSKKCATCGKYIDSDAAMCLSCIENALK